MPFERLPQKRNRVISVRLNDEEMELVEAFGKQLAREQGRKELSASDIVREALRRLSVELTTATPQSRRKK